MKGRGGRYVSMPMALRGMRGSSEVVLRSLMRWERLLALMFSWAKERLSSSISAWKLAFLS